MILPVIFIIKSITLSCLIETNLFDFFTSIDSSDETLYSILEQITVNNSCLPADLIILWPSSLSVNCYYLLAVKGSAIKN